MSAFGHIKYRRTFHFARGTAVNLSVAGPSSVRINGVEREVAAGDKYEERLTPPDGKVEVVNLGKRAAEVSLVPEV